MESTPPLPLADSPESVRRAHLTHEASIQGIGALYMLGCAVLLVAGITSIFGEGDITEKLILSCVLILIGCVQGWVGINLRKLNPKVKIAATLIACIGLLGFPLGTLINAYVLFLIHSAKGKVVFSPTYREIVAATPEIKYKTPMLVWVFLGILILILVAAIIASLS